MDISDEHRSVNYKSDDGHYLCDYGVIQDGKGCTVYLYESGEKSLMEKKPGGKTGNGKKWKKSLVERKPGVFWKRWKKSLVFFLGLIHMKINDEVKLTHSFNHLI